MAGVKAVPKVVQLFQLTCWPMGHKVPTSTNSLVELMNMVERWRQKACGPVAIVAPDGRSRAGVYCAANACIEWVDDCHVSINLKLISVNCQCAHRQVIQHSEVDVFQAVKTVRRHRPQLVGNMVRFLSKLKLIYGWSVSVWFFTLFFFSFLQTEYKYCYDLVLHYVLYYLNKENEKKWRKH